MKYFAFLFSLLTLLDLHAFTFNTYNGAAFPGHVVKLYVARTPNNKCAQINLALQDLVDLLHPAVNDYWNRVHTSRLSLEVGGVIDLPNEFGTESLCAGGCPNPKLVRSNGIIIACNDNLADFPSHGLLAATLPNNIGGNEIRNSVILINANASSIFGRLSRDEMIAVLGHEIGHAIGLGHSSNESSLMYFSLRSPIPSRRNLGRDDHDGVTYLYPRAMDALGIVDLGCGNVKLIGGGGKPGDQTFWALFAFALIASISARHRKRNKNADPLTH